MEDLAQWSKYGLAGTVIGALFLLLGWLIAALIRRLWKDDERVDKLVAAFERTHERSLATFSTEQKAERDQCRADHGAMLERMDRHAAESREMHTKTHDLLHEALFRQGPTGRPPAGG